MYQLISVKPVCGSRLVFRLKFIEIVPSDLKRNSPPIPDSSQVREIPINSPSVSFFLRIPKTSSWSIFILCQSNESSSATGRKETPPPSLRVHPEARNDRTISTRDT